jgi:hypothetical protein
MQEVIAPQASSAVVETADAMSWALCFAVSQASSAFRATVEVSSWVLSLTAPTTPATEDSSGRVLAPPVVGEEILLVSGPPKPRLDAPAMTNLLCDGS